MRSIKQLIRLDAKGKVVLKDEVRKFLQKRPKVDDTKIYDGR